MAETTSSSSAPWVEQQPYLTSGFERTDESYLGAPKQYFQGQTYAGAAPESTQSIDQLRNLANQGSAVSSNTNTLFNNTIQGNYLNNNPYLDTTYNNAADAVRRNYQNITQPGTQAQFSNAGRYGSRWHDKQNATNQAELGSTLGNLANTVYGGNYNQERARQQQMMNAAQQQAQFETLNAERLGQVGAYQEGRDSLGIQESMNKWDYGQNEKQDQLDRYLARITGNYGGVSSTRSPSNNGSGFQGAIGGGLMGYAAGNALGGYGGYGAAAGAALGGLLG